MLSLSSAETTDIGERRDSEQASLPQPASVEWAQVRLEHFVVAPELADQSNIRLGEIAGVRVEADFPSLGADDEFDRAAWVSVGTYDSPELIEIGRLKLRAHMVTDFDTFAFVGDDRQPTSDEMREAERLIQFASAAAEYVITTFLEMTAQRHKRFLARLSTPIPLLTGVLRVGNPAQRTKAGQPTRLTAFAHGTDLPSLTKMEVELIASAISAHAGPDLAWQLYGRAFRLLVLEDDLRQAVLEAAIAVEVALDGAFRRMGEMHPEIKPMVTLLIKNQRSIREQMKEGAQAVLGQSYAAVSADNYELIASLMVERNAIVHDGTSGPLDPSDVSGKLAAVRHMLEWLDTLGLPPRAGPPRRSLT